MNSQAPLKVLVSAFAFSPLKGSEFAMGWDYVRAIAENHRVWVITRTNERQETEQYLREHPDSMPNITIHHVRWSSSAFSYPLNEIPFFFMFRNWQWRAYQLALSLEKEIDFDIIHQAIPSGFREPGHLWKIGKPFVWGPVGGLQYFPMRLLNTVPLRSRPFFVAKNLSTVWAMHLSPRPRIAAKRASAIIAGTSTAAERIKKLWGKSADVLCEVSAPPSSSAPRRRLGGEPFRIIWSGRFEPRKALNLVLFALQRFNQSNANWQLVCLGDGQLFDAWRQLAASCGIADRCKFLGKIPRGEAVAAMASGHCFVQPSLYDATTSVVVEALAMGLPIVCLDHFGFRDAVNESYGIRIRPGNIKQIVRDFDAALRRLEEDEEGRYSMAVAAQKASQNYTWKCKAQVLNRIYGTIVQGSVSNSPESSRRLPVGTQ